MVRVLTKVKRRSGELLGVFDGAYAYKGPFHVQIDLTNDCNNQCLACWCNSPLLGDRKLTPHQKKESLPLPLVKQLLDDCARMGVEEIYYSGSGEPFMYPHILDVLAYTKEKGFTCFVNTNFTLMDRERLDFLMTQNIDSLTVSTWAGTPETYVATHPGRAAADFLQIKEHLTYLNRHKQVFPRVKLYNVLFSHNYHEVELMIDLARQTSCEHVEFTVVDTIPQATDALALKPQQQRELLERCQRLAARASTDPSLRKMLFQFDEFMRRISAHDDVSRALYDKNIIDHMPCYSGWLFARIIPNGDVHSCLKAHRIPAGNMHRQRFPEIWNSERQRQFRLKTKVYRKNDPFFRLIGNDPGITEAGCYKSCDDIGRNRLMHSRISSLSGWQRGIFLLTARCLKHLHRFTHAGSR